jgi:hypothetical protein
LCACRQPAALALARSRQTRGATTFRPHPHQPDLRLNPSSRHRLRHAITSIPIAPVHSAVSSLERCPTPALMRPRALTRQRTRAGVEQRLT